LGTSAAREAQIDRGKGSHDEYWPESDRERPLSPEEQALFDCDRAGCTELGNLWPLISLSLGSKVFDIVTGNNWKYTNR
jgi:hypothetical protein